LPDGWTQNGWVVRVAQERAGLREPVVTIAGINNYLFPTPLSQGRRFYS
jgi:hypothetical protein